VSDEWWLKASWLTWPDGRTHIGEHTLIREVDGGVELTDPRIRGRQQEPWSVVVSRDSQLGRAALQRLGAIPVGGEDKQQ
jgi:hypothetical protein